MQLSSRATGRCLKMCDFGLSNSLVDITSSSTRSTSPGSRAAGNVGTVHYMAPELFKMKPEYSLASTCTPVTRLWFRFLGDHFNETAVHGVL